MGRTCEQCRARARPADPRRLGLPLRDACATSLRRPQRVLVDDAAEHAHAAACAIIIPWMPSRARALTPGARPIFDPHAADLGHTRKVTLKSGGYLATTSTVD